MTEAYRIACSEIWGGISVADTDVCTRGLSASIFSMACGDVRGGDIYYFSVCSTDQLTRVAIADLRGHGTEASRLSSRLYESLQQRMNTLDGEGVLRDLNEEVRIHGFQALTTAAVLAYYTATSRLYFCYAGHPPVLVRTGGGEWKSLQLRSEQRGANLPLGVLPGAAYDQEELELRPGDRLFLYTDGVLECPDPAGEEFGVERLLQVLNRTGSMCISQVKDEVLRELRRHAGGSFSHDDCTFMAMEVIANPR